MLRHTAIRMQLLNSTVSSVAACSDCSWNEGCQKTFQVVQEHKRVSKIDGDLGQGKYRSIRIGLQRHQSCCLPPLLVTPYLICRFFDNITILSNIKVLNRDSKATNKAGMTFWFIALLANLILIIRDLLKMGPTIKYYERYWHA